MARRRVGSDVEPQAQPWLALKSVRYSVSSSDASRSAERGMLPRGSRSSPLNDFTP
jgi:hypothetical protein